MIEIKDLLVNFRNILLSEEVRKEIIKTVLKEIINLSIDTKDIEIKKGTLYLNIKPIYKNEILINRDKIFLRLQEELGKKSPHNIR